MIDNITILNGEKMEKRYGSIEAGGTKFVLAIGDEALGIINTHQIPTTTPKETLSKAISFFKENSVDAIGVGAFGPLDINSDSPTYGYITATPKPSWEGVDLLGKIKDKLNLPISFTTDVNASAYGEMVTTGLKDIVYFTIGTGIGGSAVQKGRFIGRRGHAEMGHQTVKRHPKDVDFEGICPFHKDCLEGLASGPTISARLKKRGEDVEENDEVWELISYYIAQAAVNATLTLVPERIILGGGVMSQSSMLKKVQRHFLDLLNGYVSLPCDIQDYITLPSVENNGSATVGNFALAALKTS